MSIPPRHRCAQTLSALVLATLAGTVNAQSFNVEVFNTVGSPTAPASSYGAASGQTGTWNTIRAGTLGSPNSITAVNLNGSVTGVSIQLGSNNGSSSGSFGSGDFGNLMADYAFGFGNSSQVTATVNGLTPGFYRAWVYAALPPSSASYTDPNIGTVYHPNYIYSSVNNVTADNSNAQGPNVAGTFAINKTHGIVDFKVTAAGQVVRLNVFGDSTYFAAQCALNGFQIVQYSGNRLYVDKDAVGTGTGQSWTNAMTTLNEALDVAKNSSGAITEIWVAEGVYKPTTTTNRSIAFTVPSGVKIYGGFAGTETLLSQRDFAAHTTYLSGDIGTPRVATDNSYNILVMDNCNANTLLDGFRVVSGRATNNGVGNPEGSGGGITMNDASPVIRHCDFTDHYGLDGGAIKVTGTSTPKITGCTFLRNYGGSGGGAIDFDTDKGISAQFSYVTNCFFADNSTNNGGGGILLEGKAYIANCVFTGNFAILSGAGVRVQNATADLATATITNCTFSGNNTTNPGPAVGGDGNAVTIGIYNSILWGNDAILGSGTQDAYDSDNGADFNVDRTIIQGAIVLPGFTNYNFDPLFVDADGPDNIVGTFDDDLRLQPTSAAIDRGQNSYLPSDTADVDQDINTIEQLPVDLDGSPRRFDVSTIFNTGSGTAPFVDLGAYESQYVPPCPLDYNQDTFRNLDDLGDFITDFYMDPPIPGGVQPNAPTYAGENIGYGVPCPAAGNAPAPYAINAYQTTGYRVGFSSDGNNACPLDPSQPFPNLDNLNDFITAYYASPC